MLHATKRTRKPRKSSALALAAKPEADLRLEIDANGKPVAVTKTFWVRSDPESYSEQDTIHIVAQSRQSLDVEIHLDSHAVAALKLAREAHALGIYLDELGDRPGFDEVLKSQALAAYNDFCAKTWKLVRSAICCI